MFLQRDLSLLHSTYYLSDVGSTMHYGSLFRQSGLSLIRSRVSFNLGPGYATADESVTWLGDVGQRHDVPAGEQLAHPDQQHPDLAFPGRHREDVVAAVHEPGQRSLDDEPLVLKDAVADSQGGDDSEGVMNIGAWYAASDGGDHPRPP